MKASELIQRLNQLIAEHGEDFNVRYVTGEHEHRFCVDIDLVRFVDAEEYLDQYILIE